MSSVPWITSVFASPTGSPEKKCPFQNSFFRYDRQDVIIKKRSKALGADPRPGGSVRLAFAGYGIDARFQETPRQL
jgi:hypothetical protein